MSETKMYRGVGIRIKAPFGHFRIPYTTTLKQSYPFPPKPTIIGLIGAILGWNEKTVIEETPNFQIAIPTWGYKDKIIEFIFVISVGKEKGKSRIQEEFRPERFEILVYPKYEILILHSDESLIKEIEERIKSKNFEFSLYMGKNEFPIIDIGITKQLFTVNLQDDLKTPSGIVFAPQTSIPEFRLKSEISMSVQVFRGVPLSFSISQRRRVQKETCIVLVSKGTIELIKPLSGIRLNGCEYTTI